MKKIFALMLALVMMLFSVSALADAKTVTIQTTVDKDQLTAVAPALGLPESQMNAVNGVASLLNALVIKIVAAENAGELDLDLKDGTHLLYIGGAATENGIAAGTDVLPSYLLTVSQEDIQKLVEQIMAQLPGGGQGLDINAVTQALVQYVSKFAASLQAAIVPGAEENGTYEFEGYTFDTKVPMNVDVVAIAEAVKTLVSDLVHDETIGGLLKSFGQNFDPDQIVAQMEINPDQAPEVKVDSYSNSTNSGIGYLEGEIIPKGMDKAAMTFCVLSANGAVKAVCNVVEQGITITLTGEGNTFALEVTGNGAYAAVKASASETGAVIGVYFMNTDAPILKLEIAVADGGEMKADLNPEGKTVLTLEQLQKGELEQSVQEALIQEAQTKLITLVMQLMTAVPEAGALIQGAMSGM